MALALSRALRIVGAIALAAATTSAYAVTEIQRWHSMTGK